MQLLDVGIRLSINSHINRLQSLGLNILQTSSSDRQRCQAVNSHRELLPNPRRSQVELMPCPLVIKVELKLNIINRRQIQLVNPLIYVNQQVPLQIAHAIANKLKFANLGADSIQAKVSS